MSTWACLHVAGLAIHVWLGMVGKEAPDSECSVQCSLFGMNLDVVSVRWREESRRKNLTCVLSCLFAPQRPSPSSPWATDKAHARFPAATVTLHRKQDAAHAQWRWIPSVRGRLRQFLFSPWEKGEVGVAAEGARAEAVQRRTTCKASRRRLSPSFRWVQVG